MGIVLTYFFRQNLCLFYNIFHSQALTVAFLHNHDAVPHPPICFRISAKQIGGKEFEKL